MAKNTEKESQMKFLGLLVVVLALVYLASLYLKSGDTNIFNYGNSQVPSEVDDQYLAYSVTLDITPNIICFGDTTKGTITTNIPNGICSIFYNAGTGWSLFKNVNLNANGYYSESQVVTSVGYALFRAICCDSEGNCRISNEEPLTVQMCDSATTTTLPTYDCFDGDGGINFAVDSFCEDSYHMAGFQDLCEDGYEKEWYCDDQGICQYVYGESCGGMACLAIVYPVDQGYCTGGWCQTGVCTFHPATLVSPARCGCD